MPAWNLTRADMHYRHGTFTAGLRAAGFDVRSDTPQGKPGNVLLIWNRYGHYDEQATRFEAAGGTVIVAENGYIGRDEDGNQRYAMAVHGHNGSGRWPVGGPERWDALGVDLAPWRSSGDKIVIRGQRGIGAPGMASPPNWHEQTAARLRKLTKRPIQVIPHPGNGAERDTSHEQYLQGAHALVIWSSSVGVKALAMGIPVICCAPHWICGSAADRHLECVEKVEDRGGLKTREEALQSMAWAQWSLAEIATGEPFVRLVDHERKRIAA